MTVTRVSTDQGGNTTYQLDSGGVKVISSDMMLAAQTAFSAKTVRNIAGRCMIPNKLNTGLQCMSRSYHYAGTDINWMQPVFPNWFVSGFGNTTVDGLEKGPGAACTITATLEYPIGTIAGRFTFNGETTGSIPNLSELTSDKMEGLQISKGSFFKISVFRTCSGGVVQMSNTPYGSTSFDQTKVTAATDQTGTTTDIGAANGTMYGPSAILSDSSVESLYFGPGDSICLGTDVDQGRDNLGAFGIFARAAALKFLPYTNGGVGSQRAEFFASSNTRQLTQMGYHQRVWGNVGSNDIFSGGTVAALMTDLNTIYNAIRALYPSIYLAHANLIPRLNVSTDYYTTLGGQSAAVSTYPTKLLTVNNKLEVGAVPALNGMIDVRRAMESSPGAETWAVHPKARVITDSVMAAASPTLTSASAAFKFSDEGLNIVIVGAGNAAGSSDLITTILTYNSATQVTLASNCLKTGGVSAANGYIGARYLTLDGVHPIDTANRAVLANSTVQAHLP